MHEPIVTAENVEDLDFQTFLPSQLEEVDTYFVNSSIDDSAAEDHLDLAPTAADTAVNAENLANCTPDSLHIETDSTPNKADSTLDSNSRFGSSELRTKICLQPTCDHNVCHNRL